MSTPNPAIPYWNTPATPPPVVGGNPRTAIANSNYSILSTDRYVALTSISSNLIWTLPLASAFPVGTILWLQDESGSINSFAPARLTINRSGSDVIDSNLTAIVFDQPNQGMLFESNGATGWTTLNGVPITNTSFGDADLLLGNTSRFVFTKNALSAPRTLTLPPAASFGRNTAIVLIDIIGTCTAVNTITAARSVSDTINGATSAVAISAAFGGAIFYTDGVSLWAMQKWGAGGSSAPSTRLPLKGDNAGGILAESIQAMGDASAAISAGTNIVNLTTALTAARVLTLPAASGYAPGDTITIQDPKRVVTTANTIAIARAGSDTINGAAGNVVVLNAPGQTCVVELDSTGTNWGVLSSICVNPVNATGPSSNSEWFLRGPSNAGIGSASGGVGASDVVLFANNLAAFLTAQSQAQVLIPSNWSYGISASTIPSGTFADIAIGRSAAGRAQINNGTVGTLRDLDLRSLLLDKTVTAGGTTGNQTINKAAGTVNIAAGQSAITVTNSLVVVGSIIVCVVRTADATLTFIKSVVAAAGSFVITCNANATAETSIGFAIVA